MKTFKQEIKSIQKRLDKLEQPDAFKKAADMVIKLWREKRPDEVEPIPSRKLSEQGDDGTWFVREAMMGDLIAVVDGGNVVLVADCVDLAGEFFGGGNP